MSRRFITHDGLTMTLADWERHLGIKKHSMTRWLRDGYTMEDIVAGRIRKQGERTPEGEARKNRAVTKHGNARDDTQTPEYRAWADMKNRCLHATNCNYQFYGGRGIHVCQHFLTFPNFIACLGKKPGRRYSLDRRDNNGHYSCGACDECRQNGWTENCRWATRDTQDNNRRNSVYIEHDGLRLSLSQWARKLGVSRDLFHNRRKAGRVGIQILEGFI